MQCAGFQSQLDGGRKIMQLWLAHQTAVDNDF